MAREKPLSEDGRLVQRLRHGDAEAGRRFVHDHYPAIYRHLLYLTGRREMAEDLTQETFLQAWSALDTFDRSASLRPWLHRIAHREFLQALRAQRPEASLESILEPIDPCSLELTEAVELRAILDTLPVKEREMVVLHHLEGYSYHEIAEIVGAPIRRVRQRLFEARERLRRALGEGDLVYLNEQPVRMRQWEEIMERREFLRQAAVGAAGLMLTEPEKEVVDTRLTQKVTCAFKATPLSDLCEKLKTDTGIQVAAGPSVADETVTLFCEKLPLREVMRQLSRPFGYTWLRSGTPSQYRYELVQDLRSQLLEEELRNRDRDAALLALDREIDRYRPYLDLSPDEALARARTAPPAEKKLLEKLAGCGWGPIQMYFRLSPQHMAALRAGQEVKFSQQPNPGEQPLPADVAHGVLQSFRGWGLQKSTVLDIGFDGTDDLTQPGSEPLTTAPAARARAVVSMGQGELGQYALNGSSGFFVGGNPGRDGIVPGANNSNGPYAVGASAAVQEPDNAAANARLARDPELQRHVSLQPQPSCHPPVDSSSPTGSRPEPKVTTADVLEALHRATGMPIVADFYTRLYAPEVVAVRNEPLFQALNRLCDTMRLRWRKEGGSGGAGYAPGGATWLQLRSAGYYHDRLKEVPNRLLTGWATMRRQQGLLSLDELCEIAQLSDAQLDGADMAEGARDCFGLEEWELARNGHLRPHLRYLATFTPEQRKMTMSPEGLPFTRMSLAQQQQFLVSAIGQPLESMDELAGAVLRVEYTHPGEFQWLPPKALRWIMPVEPGPQGRRALMPPVRARTREAVLRQVRRIEPQVREAALKSGRYYQIPEERTLAYLQEAEIVPTRMDLVIAYIPGMANRLLIHEFSRDVDRGFKV